MKLLLKIIAFPFIFATAAVKALSTNPFAALVTMFTGLVLVAGGNDFGLVFLIPAFVHLIRMETVADN
jgi:hypothetical protein